MTVVFFALIVGVLLDALPWAPAVGERLAALCAVVVAAGIVHGSFVESLLVSLGRNVTALAGQIISSKDPGLGAQIATNGMAAITFVACVLWFLALWPARWKFGHKIFGDAVSLELKSWLIWVPPIVLIAWGSAIPGRAGSFFRGMFTLLDQVGIMFINALFHKGA